MIPYTLIRSNRKTVCIRLTACGDVVVRAPHRCARSYIDRFVADHQGWILTHQEMLLDRKARQEAFHLREGDTVSLLGERIPVRIVPGCQTRLWNGALYLPSGDMELVRKDILTLA